MPEPIDLDKARVARQEKLAVPPPLRFGGEDFELPMELPADFSFCLAEGKSRDAIAAVLGDQYEAFWKHGPTMNDLYLFIDEVTNHYGFGSTGESSASGSRSGSTGKRSRPTSKGSTPST